MKQKEKQIQIEYRLLKILINKFLLYPNDGSFDKNKVEINFNTNLEISSVEELIRHNFNVLYRNIDTKKIYLETQIFIFFKVKDLKKFQVENNKFKLPDPFINNLIAISVSTVRGILFVKVSGTYLNEVLIPIIKLR